MTDSGGEEIPEPWEFALGERTAPRVFAIGEARALLPEVLARADELINTRADLAELAVELRGEGGAAAGAMAELKALEARLGELRSWFLGQGIEVKGVAPLLLDFPAVFDGISVRLCWLEGDTELAWYHRTDLGFMGRRPLPPTAEG